MTTIYDIARLAGVSRATVSRVLNNSDKVSDEVRERVLQIIKQYNYEPNVLARALTIKKSQTIAVVHKATEEGIIDIDVNPFFSAVMRGILREAKRNGLLLMHFEIYNEEDLSSLIRALRGQAVDGLLLLGPFEREIILTCLAEEKPLVLVDNDVSDLDVNAVLCDNRKGVKLAMQYLFNLGHRMIGFIGGSLKRLPFRERFEAYKECLQEKGIPYRDELVSIGEIHGDVLVQKFLGAKTFPTAILGSNDIRVLEAATVLKKLGLRIPDDVSIFGYDDVPSERLLEVGLSTISIPKQEMGRLAVQRLYNLMKNGGKTVEKKRLDVKMVVRGSVTVARDIKDTMKNCE